MICSKLSPFHHLIFELASIDLLVINLMRLRPSFQKQIVLFFVILQLFRELGGRYYVTQACLFGFDCIFDVFGEVFFAATVDDEIRLGLLMECFFSIIFYHLFIATSIYIFYSQKVI